MHIKMTHKNEATIPAPGAAGYLVQVSFKDEYFKTDLRRCLFVNSIENPRVFETLAPAPFYTPYKIGVAAIPKKEFSVLEQDVREFSGKGAASYSVEYSRLNAKEIFVLPCVAQILPLTDGQFVKQGNAPLYAYSEKTGWAPARDVCNKLKEYLENKGYSVVWE